MSGEWLVVPLVPGTKRAKGKWNRKLYREHPERTVAMPMTELVRRKDEFFPFDVGLLLEYNGLVLVDADTEKGEWVTGEDGTARLMPGADGPAELRAWMAANPGALPETYLERSPGDPGRHARGEHWIYKQNPAEPVRGSWRPLPGVDFKAHGIMRIAVTGEQLTEIVNDTDPVTIPAETVRAFKAMRAKDSQRGASRASSSGSGDGTGQDDQLFRLARSLKRSGLDEETAYTAWQAVADGLPLKDPAWRWTREDFDRHFREMDEEPQEQNRRSNNVHSNTTEHVREELPDRLNKYDDTWMPEPINGKTPEQFMRRVDAKLKAEAHATALLNDWKRLPESYQHFYQHVGLRIRAGTLRDAEDPWLLSRAPAGALRTLSSPEHPLLADFSGYVVMLKDTTPPEGKEYPGWGDKSTEGLGQVPYEVADTITALILVSAGKEDKAISDGHVAYIANKAGFREKYELTSYMPWNRYTVQRARKRLIAAGLLVEIKSGERFRKDRRWQYTPPVYGPGEPRQEQPAAEEPEQGQPKRERRPYKPMDEHVFHGKACPVCAPMQEWLEKVCANTREEREKRKRGMCDPRLNSRRRSTA